MLNGCVTKCIEYPVVPQKLPSFDRAGADEYGRANPIFLEDWKCIFVIVAISVIERDCDCSSRNVPLPASLDQFQKRHDAVIPAQKLDLFLEHCRVNRLEERVRIR